MKPVISIGNQDFGSIRENRYFYVDKTDFIRQWWENGDVVTLITRPRRFGKTLNMSMLEYFFSNQYAGYGKLFENRQIWQYKKYQELQESDSAIWSLLLASGYLKADQIPEDAQGIYRLSITNHEVGNMFRKMISQWFRKSNVRSNTR